MLIVIFLSFSRNYWMGGAVSLEDISGYGNTKQEALDAFKSYFQWYYGEDVWNDGYSKHTVTPDNGLTTQEVHEIEYDHRTYHLQFENKNGRWMCRFNGCI